ncbi:MAG: hypothetical protein AAF675_00395 [Pseudomonadota bacterium]
MLESAAGHAGGSAATATQPMLPPPGLAALLPGRVHEACGPGRLAFAAALAGEAEGPLLWIRDATRRDRLCPTGLARLFDPGRLVIARPTGALAALQVLEEALRSGACPLVVAELEAAPDLTQSRRLQLAAGTGRGRGLCLVPESRLATNAAETRWRCTPAARPRDGIGRGGNGQGVQPGLDTALTAPGALQLWELVKNKRGPLGLWEVTLNAGALAGPPSPLATSPATARRHPAPDIATDIATDTAIGGIRALHA